MRMLIKNDSFGFNSHQAFEAAAKRPLRNKAPYDVLIVTNDSFSFDFFV